MQLVLIRHAEPERVVSPVVSRAGRADPDLTARGREQALLTAEWLGREAIAAVWSSPLRRALATAEPLAASLGLPLASDERLSEYDRDFPDYIPVEELRASDHPRWRAMREGRWNEFASIDLPSFRARVHEALEDRIAENPGRRVAVVAHGGVINVWLGFLLGIERPLWFDPGYASLHRVAASRSGVRSVVSLNETAHLDPRARPENRGHPRGGADGQLTAR